MSECCRKTVAVACGPQLRSRFGAGRDQDAIKVLCPLSRFDDKVRILFCHGRHFGIGEDADSRLCNGAFEREEYRFGLIGERVASAVVLDVEHETDRVAEGLEIAERELF